MDASTGEPDLSRLLPLPTEEIALVGALARLHDRPRLGTRKPLITAGTLITRRRLSGRCRSERDLAKTPCASPKGGRAEEEPGRGPSPARSDNFGGWRDWLLAGCAPLVLIAGLVMYTVIVGRNREIFSVPLEIAIPVSLLGVIIAIWSSRRRGS